MKHEVIDNFLNEIDFLRIKNLMLSGDFPWYYQSNTTFEDPKKSTFYFIHKFYDYYTVNTHTDYWQTIYPLIAKIDPKSLIRVKGNLYPGFDVKISNDLHLDYEYPHKAAILYINNNNGPTIFEDGTEITPVENRVLFFEGHKLHKSTHCSDEKIRVNININYF
jgi:hypothetical protein